MNLVIYRNEIKIDLLFILELNLVDEDVKKVKLNFYFLKGKF